MYNNNFNLNNNNSKSEKKGCRFSCCSCSCLLIVINFILLIILLIYVAYYWCWNIDNRIIEKLKTGEVDSNNAKEYIVNTITDYLNPKNNNISNDNNIKTEENNDASFPDKIKNIIINQQEQIDNIIDENDSDEENENTDNDNSEELTTEKSDFNEVNQLLKTNKIRKNLDKVIKLDSKGFNGDIQLFSDENIETNNNPVVENEINLSTNTKKTDKYDYLSDLSEDKLLEKIGDNLEENKAILKIAIDKDFGIVLKQLLIKNSNISNELIENKSLLFYSAEKNSIKCRNYLINNGADLKCEYQGKNLLHVAAHKGDLKLAKKCLSIGLPINKPTDIGYTPFYFSVMSDNLNMIKYLVENGAKVDKNLKYLAKSREVYNYLNSFE